MFYHNFINLCNKRGISPSAAAEEMGYQRSVVTRWSKGTAPRQATIQRVADFFGVAVSELTEDAENEKKPALISEDELDDTTKELLRIAHEIDAADRQMLLEMARTIRKRREA